MNGDVYNMELHEKLYDEAGTTIVTRVPGGWIYEMLTHYLADTAIGRDLEYRPTAVFVPLEPEA